MNHAGTKPGEIHNGETNHKLSVLLHRRSTEGNDQHHEPERRHDPPLNKDNAISSRKNDVEKKRPDGVHLWGTRSR